MTSCIPVTRGTVSQHTGPSLYLLNYGYTYRPTDRRDAHDSHGNLYFFGNDASASTRAYLHQQFRLRHGNATLIEFNLISKQP